MKAFCYINIKTADELKYLGSIINEYGSRQRDV